MWHINCSFKNILSQIASVFCVSKITTCSKNERERYDKTSSFATYLAPVNVGNFGKPNYSWHFFSKTLVFGISLPKNMDGLFCRLKICCAEEPSLSPLGSLVNMCIFLMVSLNIHWGVALFHGFSQMIRDSCLECVLPYQLSLSTSFAPSFLDLR